jgi:hypothetical protein
MNRITPLLTGLLVLLLTAFRSDKAPTTFKYQLEKAGMTFEMPKGFAETDIIPNRQMSYDYAIKHGEKQFEVRFALRPLGDLIKNYTELEKNKKPGDINLSPNKVYTTSLQTTVLNISGGRMPQFNLFPPLAVKAEFNAEWGATTIFEVGKEFGQTYKYCMVVAVHKNNFADAYYFYLSDKQETINELIEPVFHCLKFK